MPTIDQAVDEVLGTRPRADAAGLGPSVPGPGPAAPTSPTTAGPTVPSLSAPSPLPRAAAPKAPDPFGAAVDAVLQDDAASRRTALVDAVRVNPDQAAQAARLARQTGTPDDVVLRNLRDVQLQQAVESADAKLRTNVPALQRAMREPSFARQAHDDLDSLGKMESSVLGMGAAGLAQATLGLGEAVLRTPDTLSRMAGYVAGMPEALGLPRSLNPIRGVQQVADFFGRGEIPGLGKRFEGATDAANRLNDATGLLARDPQTFSPAFKDLQAKGQSADQALKAALQGDMKPLAQTLSDPGAWIGFLAQAVPSLYVAMKSGGSLGVMGWLEGMDQASSAADFEQRTGQKISDADFSQAFMQTATINALLERAGLEKVLGAHGKGLSGIFKAMVGEGGTEGLQQINSNLAEMLAYNQGKSLTEGVVASVMGGAGAGGGVAGAGHAASKLGAVVANYNQRQTQAQAATQQLTAILQTAAGSKLRERSPQTFAKFVQQAGQTHGLEEVYIDASALEAALHQSGISAEQLAQTMPSVGPQMEVARASGGAVALPIGEVAATLPGTPLEAALLPHLRTDPDGISQHEAEQEALKAGEFLKQSAERVLAEDANAQATAASAEQVRQTVLDQLNATQRFKPDVHEAYATLVRDFYTTTAARSGLTPEALYARYPLRIAAQSVAGPALRQGAGQTETPEFKAWFGDNSSMVDEAGKPLTLYHGTTKQGGKLSVFRRSKTGAMGPAIYLGDSKQASEGYDQGAMLQVYARGKYLSNRQWSEYVQQHGWAGAEAAARADGWSGVYDRNFENAVAVWDPHDIKSATGNRGTFDPASPDIYAQSAAPTGAVTTDENGYPEIHTPDIWLMAAQPTERFEVIPGDGQQLLSFAMLSPAGEYLGYTELMIEGGKVSGLYDIEVNKDARKQGTGAKVIEAILASNPDASILISNVVPAARGFWEQVGVPQQNVGEGDAYDGQLDWNTYAASPAGQKRGAAARDLGADTSAGRGADTAAGAGGTGAPRSRLEQSSIEAAPRAFFDPATLTIGLLKDANLSSFLHESGHFFLEVLADMASQPDAPAGVVADMQALLDWFGVTDLYEWNTRTLDQKRPHHERFAESFEKYLFEGKAPNQELRPLFQRFRSWMLQVYKSLADFGRGRDLRLSDEVRSVFDRMLATDEQIAQAQRMAGYEAVYKTAQESGLSPEEWAQYQATHAASTREAIEQLQARSLGDLKWSQRAHSRELRRLQAEVKALRQAMQEQVAAEVQQRPVYAALHWLKKGILPDGTQTEGAKLNTDALREMYGSDETAPWRKLGTNLRNSDPLRSLHPDVVAEMFGFRSGDHLVQDLIHAPPIAQVIEALTDERLLAEHGELITPAGMDRAATEAVHNEAHARAVATDLAVMAKTSNSRVMLAAAKQFAQELVSRLRVRDLRPARYTSAEARAARLAATLSAQGDTQGAIKAKQDQLLNSQAARQVLLAQDEVDQALRYLRKFDKDAVRQKLPADYLDQIDALLDDVDLRPSSLKSVDRRTSLAQWVQAQQEQGIEPDLPPELLGRALRTAHQNLSLEQMRGLVDAVKQIEHLGQLKNRLLLAKGERELEAVKAEISQSITEHAGDRRAVNRTATSGMGRTLEFLRNFRSAHFKVPMLARLLDGLRDGGPMWQHFVRTANERGDFETTRRAEATQALTRILEPWLKGGRKTREFPSINRSLSREEVLVMALNVGNEGNLQRLLDGEGWTLAQLMPVLQSLNAAEWGAVQQVWDHFESFRPEIAAQQTRLLGREPEWIEPGSPATQALGVKGGYYPVKYDPLASARAEELLDAEAAKQLLRGSYGAATTRDSFTKARAKEVHDRPLLYSLSGLYGGVNEVIHNLAWQEWLIDTNRLLRSKRIQDAIRDHYGADILRQFKSWRDDVARGEQGSNSAGEAMATRLRQGVSMAGLSFNIVNALIQPVGITQSWTRIGGRWVGQGVAQSLTRPFEAASQVNAQSDFMANRARTRFRELNELRNRVQGQTAGRRWLQEHAYVIMMSFQQMVDVPTWLGAQAKALAEGADDDTARAVADQAVRDAQGGGQVHDLSAIERGGPFQKLFTVFYGFMNTTFNLMGASLMSRQSAAKKAADMFMLVSVPAVLTALFKQAIVPSADGGDEEDDPLALAGKLVGLQLDYLMGTMMISRELSFVARRLFMPGGYQHDYQGPAGLRVLADLENTVKQTAQVIHDNGEFDEAFFKSIVNLASSWYGLPGAQINRSITGVRALMEGETDNPAAVLLGYKAKP